MSEQNSEPRPFDPPAPQATPSVPQANPVPPVPRYGEYAPTGHVPPVHATAPAAPANPYGVPGYAAPARPANAYGPAPTAPTNAPFVRARRTWDLVLTIILLVLGLFGMGIALLYAAILPSIVQQLFTQEHLGTFSGSTSGASLAIAVSHIVLYLVAAGISIPLLLRHRVAFWIPLVTGVVAFFLFWGIIVSTVLGDPGASRLLNP